MSNVSSPHRIPSTPYEDATAYLRRWRQYEPGDAIPRAVLPVFVADHVPLADRREGCVVFFHDGGGDRPPVLAVVPDGPSDPTEEECLGMVTGYLTRIAGYDGSGDLGGLRVGLLLHRRGPARVTDLDRRWRRAVDDAASAVRISVLGVCARTWSGAVVAIPRGRAGSEE